MRSIRLPKGVMAFVIWLSGYCCQGSGQSAREDREILVTEALDVAVTDHETVTTDNCPAGMQDIPPLGHPWICQDRPFEEMGKCSGEYFNQICGLDEAERLMETGQCPPSDRSVIGEKERLILGGDPENKTTLPKGAECPHGFERLPRITVPSETCWFQPTCMGAGWATRIPEPAILDGQYILSGLDAFRLADPVSGFANPDTLYSNNKNEGIFGADSLYGLSEICDGIVLEDGECSGCRVLEDPWPRLARDAYPPAEVKDGKMKVCAAKEGPWIDMKKREVVALYGGFFSVVQIPNFQTNGGCRLWRLDILTHCCGPILMLWPEDVAELRATLEPACQEQRAKVAEMAAKAGRPVEEYKEYMRLQVVAPRTKGLVHLGIAADTAAPWRSGGWGPDCANSASCQYCAARNILYQDCMSDSGWADTDEDILKCYDRSEFNRLLEGHELTLTLDDDGHPENVIYKYATSCWHESCAYLGSWKCEYAEFSVPYRTPEEVAKEIPPL